ncbi:MAG: hypothetical protein QS721_03185 [Candidatus Endonucleobacter sp. (ex Gigantidas childressi)]|nr:hypothetical protein [Candidatus Endonucleobacter sp. (ex Gigantidas childressi)]
MPLAFSCAAGEYRNKTSIVVMSYISVTESADNVIVVRNIDGSRCFIALKDIGNE